MQTEVLKSIFKEIKDANDWMHDSAGNNFEDSPEELAKDCGDVYEVIVEVHLVNGTTITLNNRCKESYIKKRYVGDRINVYNNIVYAEYENEFGTFHQARINPESIVMIDQYDEKVDWTDLIKK